MARRPQHQRSAAKGVFASPPPGVDLADIAGQAIFIGDPQHKDIVFFAGTAFERRPLPRRNECGQATLCPHEFSNHQDQLTAMLQDAIRKGQVEGPWKSGFPQRVWTRQLDDNGNTVRVFAARHSANGQYKG